MPLSSSRTSHSPAGSTNRRRRRAFHEAAGLAAGLAVLFTATLGLTLGAQPAHAQYYEPYYVPGPGYRYAPPPDAPPPALPPQNVAPLLRSMGFRQVKFIKRVRDDYIVEATELDGTRVQLRVDRYSGELISSRAIAPPGGYDAQQQPRPPAGLPRAATVPPPRPDAAAVPVPPKAPPERNASTPPATPPVTDPKIAANPPVSATPDADKDKVRVIPGVAVPGSSAPQPPETGTTDTGASGAKAGSVQAEPTKPADGGTPEKTEAMKPKRPRISAGTGTPSTGGAGTASVLATPPSP